MLVDVADFFSDLGITSVDLFPLDRRALPRTAGGQILPIQLGPRLWTGTITVQRYPHVEANTVRARIARLTEADATFLLFPPELDDTGQTGTLATIGSDRRQITLTGVTVAEGDYLGVTASDVYGLHLVTAVNGGDVEVVPPIPRSIGAGAIATTQRPKMAAVMQPDTRGPALSAVLSDGFSFSFIQTLRAVS